MDWMTMNIVPLMHNSEDADHNDSTISMLDEECLKGLGNKTKMAARMLNCIQMGVEAAMFIRFGEAWESDDAVSPKAREDGHPRRMFSD